MHGQHIIPSYHLIQVPNPVSERRGGVSMAPYSENLMFKWFNLVFTPAHIATRSEWMGTGHALIRTGILDEEVNH